MTEAYFQAFREKTIGTEQVFETAYGPQKMIYADWTASGRLYGPIEDTIAREMGPFVGNTHTETTVTGTLMTHAYHKSKQVIKEHVNADELDVLLFCGSGMTGAINKLQRILGLRIPERFGNYLRRGVFQKLMGGGKCQVEASERPVVFITHMEHHSNHTSWLETICDLEIIGHTPEGLVDLADLVRLLFKYKDRKLKIASVTACSNVTGIQTPHHEIARLMHQNEGFCFVDFACSGPYVKIDMHPEDSDARLDAVFLSPHKFLGGPGTPGVVIFNSTLYRNLVPDTPGGGTVVWTNPWEDHKYLNDIEEREDGGTPPFLQGIRAGLAVKLKEEMGIENIMVREHQLTHRVLEAFEEIPNLHVLAGHHKNRMGVISFTVPGLHYHLAVKLLNDRFGIQVRGGCACAGTYGHFLLEMDPNTSKKIFREISSGDQTNRPGWVRMSVHPIMTDAEVEYMIESVKAVCANFQEWSKDYEYMPKANDFCLRQEAHNEREKALVAEWFNCCQTENSLVK